MPPPDERLMEDQDIAKSPRPGARAKSSAWAGCLGLSRATAIKPDATLCRPRRRKSQARLRKMATTGAVRSPVTMAMMHVRNVQMRMSQRLVLVNMRVRFAGRVMSTMAMSVVLVVNMRMSVRHCRMGMFVFVTFGQV